MGQRKSTEKEKPEDPRLEEWQERSTDERRSKGGDKRTAQSTDFFSKRRKERRKVMERRQSGERRDRWMRIGRWRSVSVFDE